LVRFQEQNDSGKTNLNKKRKWKIFILAFLIEDLILLNNIERRRVGVKGYKARVGY